MTYDDIKEQTAKAVKEVLEQAVLKENDIFVIGCSTSEINGFHIGEGSDYDTARAVCEGALDVLRPRGIYLAAQCCEHLNRAIIIERSALRENWEIVNVVPQPHAGGSFATTFYLEADDPVAVEEVRADAGLDIGDTLIGMHLRRVAVPIRINVKEIGKAHVTCARTRPKYIGGERAIYDPELIGDEIMR